MPTIAVDLDGTLTVDPDGLKHMMCQLRVAGWRVLILTGQQDGRPNRQEKSDLLLNLKVHPGIHFDSLEIVEGKDQMARAQAKAKFCKVHHVDYVIDDDEVYLEVILEVNPRIVPLQFKK